MHLFKGRCGDITQGYKGRSHLEAELSSLCRRGTPGLFLELSISRRIHSGAW